MNWQQQLDQAANVEAVLQVLNDYIAALPRGRDIPAAYRPLVVRRAEDVYRWHRLLTIAVGATTSPSPAFEELSVTFMRAAARLYELVPASRPANGNGNGDNAVGSG